MSVCLSVMAIDSAPGSDTVLRPISLELVYLRVCNVNKLFTKSDQWPNYQRKMLRH